MINRQNFYILCFLLHVFIFTAWKAGGDTATLTMAVNPAGGGSVNPTSGDHSVTIGDTQAITAMPASGYYFVYWSGTSNAAITNVYSSETTVTLTGDATVTAVFSEAKPNFIIERVSLDGSGTEGNDTSERPSISPDGRYVAFASAATNLVPGDTNGVKDIFLYDRNTDTIRRISVDNNGNEANGASWSPVIASDANGTFVAFVSAATNLVSGDTNGCDDIFVYDCKNDTIERVSVDDAGTEGNGDSSSPAISSDGRYVAFASAATNLVSGDSNSAIDIFVYDRQNDTIERVSKDNSSVQGNADSYTPAISGDGRYVAFASAATNLVSNDTNSNIDIFVYDRTLNSIKRISVAGDGTQGNFDSLYPAISFDGSYIAFCSKSSTLLTGDTNFSFDIFVYDMNEDTLEEVSKDNTGNLGNSDSLYPSLSWDGRYVAFMSAATNFVTNDTNGYNDIFVYDRRLNRIERVNIAADGTQTDNDSNYPVISRYGRYVAFQSLATTLIAGDTNSKQDVFVSIRDPITVITPNGGETWYGGNTEKITWSSVGFTGDVKIELYKAGSLFKILTSSTDNDGEFDWTIDKYQESATTYSIKISSVTDTSLTDESNNTFTVQPTFDLDMVVSPSDAGSVTPGDTTLHTTAAQAITATAQTYYHFVNWSASSGATIADPNSATTTVSLVADATVTANFAHDTATLTIEVYPANAGTTNPTPGDHTINVMEAQSILATSYTGYHFVNWEVVSGDPDIEDENSASTTVTITANATIRANFEIDTATLTMAASPAGGGNVSPAVGSHTVNIGESQNISATPAANYHFVRWQSAGSGVTIDNPNSADTTVTLNISNSTVTVTANFEHDTALLTIGVSPLDGGSTTPSTGTSSVNIGEPVQITATAANYYHFVRWEVTNGDAVITDTEFPKTTVTITENSSIRAVFEHDQTTYTIAVSPSGTGTVSPSPGTYTVNVDEEQLITATPAQHYHFVKWIADSSNAQFTNANSATTTVSLLGFAIVTATFEHDTATLTMASSPSDGGTTEPSQGGHSVNTYTEYEITATPAQHYHFVKWTIDGNGTLKDENSQSTTVTLTDNVTVTANFAHDTAKLTMVVSPEDSGTLTPAAGTTTVNTAEKVTIKAVPASEYYFVGWQISGSGTIGDPTRAETYVTITADTTVTAVFKHQPILTMKAYPEDRGTTSPNPNTQTTVTVNTPQTITATAKPGYNFSHWKVEGDATIKDENLAITTITLHGDTTVTAYFIEPVTLTMAVSPSSAGETDPSVGTSVTVEVGSSYNIQATAAKGYTFIRWLIDGNAKVEDENSGNTSVTLYSDTTLTAYFSANANIYMLTMEADPENAGTTKPSGIVSVVKGEAQTITAIPNTGYAFKSWSVSGGGSIDNPSLSTTKVTLMSGDATVTANFIKTYNLEMKVSPDDSGTTNPAIGVHEIKEGSTVNVSATPAEGYHFVSWTLEGDASLGNENLPLTTISLNGVTTLTANFAENTQGLQELNVLSPNGGETIDIGSQFAICWRSQGISGNIRIELLQSGELCKVINADTENTGFYLWTVNTNLEQGENYTVRVVSIDNPNISDISNASFSIQAISPGSITLTSPNGGERFKKGSYATITWQSDYYSYRVSLRLYKGSDFYYLIASSLSNNGTYLWYVPENIQEGSDYYIRIVSDRNPEVYDESNAFFTISDSLPEYTLTLTSPEKGTLWEPGQTKSVTWTASKYLTGNVSIKLYKGESSVSSIVENISVDKGSYSWSIPSDVEEGTDYRIKIESSENSEIFDFTDYYFTIASSYSSDLTVSKSPTDRGGTVSPSGSSEVVTGSPIEISALPDENFDFIKWIASGKVTIKNIYAKKTTAVVTGDAYITALFARNMTIRSLNIKLYNNKFDSDGNRIYQDSVVIPKIYFPGPYPSRFDPNNDIVRVMIDNWVYTLSSNTGNFSRKGSFKYRFQSDSTDKTKKVSLNLYMDKGECTFSAKGVNIFPYIDTSDGIRIVVDIEHPDDNSHESFVTTVDTEERTSWTFNSDKNTIIYNPDDYFYIHKLTGSYKFNAKRKYLNRFSILQAYIFKEIDFDNTKDPVTIDIEGFWSRTFFLQESKKGKKIYSINKTEDNGTKYSLYIDLEKGRWKFKLYGTDLHGISDIDGLKVSLSLGSHSYSVNLFPYHKINLIYKYKKPK